MEKENPFDSATNWYGLWMQQSKDFFLSADQHLKSMFGEQSSVNPEEHLDEINAWLNNLKKQWEMAQLNEEQKAYAMYWKIMNEMCKEASDMMLAQWIKKSHDKKPIQSIRELYELWLNCCHDVYQRHLHTKSYQDSYTEFMNAAFKFWQQSLNR